MVEQVSAWKATDGTVCASQEEAERIDAAEALRKTGLFNPGQISQIVCRALEVVNILDPLANLERVKPPRGSDA